MDDATGKVFGQLCAHVKANGAEATMTRAQLQAAAKLSEAAFMAVLHELRGPNKDQDAQVRFVDRDPDRITLGFQWRRDCEAKR